MDPESVGERVALVAAAACDEAAGRDAIADALVAAREIESWVQARVAGLVERLSMVEAFPEATIADAGRCSLAQARRETERSAALAGAPRLGGGPGGRG
jgi:hypothetical protein